jgi:hypothetical protein
MQHPLTCVGTYPNIFSSHLSYPFNSRSGDYAHDVGFLHDDQLVAVELHFGARPFAEQHPVAGLDVERMDLAILASRARPGGEIGVARVKLFLVFSSRTSGSLASLRGRRVAAA